MRKNWADVIIIPYLSTLTKVWLQHWTKGRAYGSMNGKGRQMSGVRLVIFLTD